MTGDEIWFADSAWNFLRSGVPARTIHADLVGSAIADYLPPVVTLVQAAAFALLGLTPEAIGAQSVLAPVAVMALVFTIARWMGARLLWAGLASLGVLGSQCFLRAGLYVRYEAMVAVFLLAYLAATLRAFPRALPASPSPSMGAGRGGGALSWHILRGVALALAGLSYYPTAPFIGLAALMIELGRAWESRRVIVAWTGMTIGFAPPAAFFAWHVARHREIFAAQILNNGAANYFAFDLLRHPLAAARGALDAAPETLALAALLVVGGVTLRRAPRRIGLLLVATAIMTLPALIYPFQARLLAPPMLLALVIAARWAGEPGRWRRLAARLGLIGFVGVAGIGLSLMLATLLFQGRARDYRAVESALGAMLTEPGAAAIDQRAWLALRATQPDRALVQVFNPAAPPQVMIFRSTLLGTAEGGETLRYWVLNADDAAATIAGTPALAASAGQMVEIGRVRPPFISLPWAGRPPYDLIVYGRTDGAVAPSKVPSGP